jgi:hypothetical protein
MLKRGNAHRASGAHDSALADYLAAGRKSFPLAVKSTTGKLQVSDGSSTRDIAGVKQGDVLDVSLIQGDFYWVVAVNGDNTAQGWIRGAAFREPAVAVSQPAEQNTYNPQPQRDRGHSWQPPWQHWHHWGGWHGW